MLKVLEAFLLAFFIAGAMLISRWLGQQAYTWMPPQATAEAQRVDDLFSFLVSVGAFVFLGLVGMMLYSVIFFRAKPDDYSEGHPSRGSAKLELLWLVAPTLLVLWIAVQNINIYQQLDILGLKQIVQLPLGSPAIAASEPDQPTVAPQAPLFVHSHSASLTKAASEPDQPTAASIRVLAKQWEWTFQYPNQATSHALHLPVNQSTRLDLQAETVIHGFYVPAFRLKQDIIPGREIALVVTPIRIGKYRLQDSQYSGTYFALMSADVVVESQEAYNQWLAAAAQQPSEVANAAIAEQLQPPQTVFKNRMADSDNNSGGKSGSLSGWRLMTNPSLSPDSPNDTAAAQPDPIAWRDYLRFSTDHKVIGVQYIITTFIFFLIGGVMAMLVRAELMTPELNLVDRPFYNALFTLHGTVMIFLWIIPFNAGLSNYLVPLMIGARDMAFPLLNAISFWIIPPAGILLIASFLLPNGPAQAGWWSYPPVSLQAPSGQLVWIISLILLGISSVMGAVNFVTTIVWLRAPGMTFFRMPVFVWSVLSAQLLQLINLPSLTGALILLLFDLAFGTSVFKPSQGGDPIIYQHLFWFYSHPAVYIMALPAFGILAEVLPAFARNPLFGYRSMAIASLGIAVVSIFVWVHHMFASATPEWMRITFVITSMLVAVPTGVKVFGWTATIWRGKLHLDTPMLFAMGGAVMFIFGGITGVMLASNAFDLHVNNTYFVVGHFHYIVFNTITLAIFAAIYFWFPKVTGRMYAEGWGKLHFWLTFIGANLTFFPMHPLGLQGMVRRVASYAPEYQGWNVIASLGAFLLGVSTLPFIANMIGSALGGERATANPWEATGLEWTTSSPPPRENFAEIPQVTFPPYNYGNPAAYGEAVATPAGEESNDE